MFFTKIFGLISIISISVLIAFGIIYDSKNDDLLITFIDVGQGDSIFIQAPNGNQVLVDAGSTKKVLRGLGDSMNWFDRELDIVIGTHPDLDHIGGITSVLDIYKVDRLIVNLTKRDDELSDILSDSSDYDLYQGDRLVLDKDVYIDVLWPPIGREFDDKNDSSYVLKLVYKNTDVLLTGDISISVEKELINNFKENLKSDVLKIGHHGSDTSTSIEFLSLVNPEIAIIQVGENKYGHPSGEVLKRLEDFNIKILRNDIDGNIFLESNGENFSVIDK